MKATQEDFSKVMMVVAEQISRVLALKPATLEKFNARLQDLTYEKITLFWDSERQEQVTNVVLIYSKGQKSLNGLNKLKLNKAIYFASLSKALSS